MLRETKPEREGGRVGLGPASKGQVGHRHRAGYWAKGPAVLHWTDMADLAAHLVRSGVLAPDAAARALAAAHDGDVASAALRLGLATEGDLVRALADLRGCPGVDFSKTVIPTANLEVVARRLLPAARGAARSPLGKCELVLAMADPEDHPLADEIRFVTGRKVLRYVAVPAALERTLDGVVRERKRGVASWRGANAPALPDPAAAWVGVVHATAKKSSSDTGGIELPEITSTMEVVGVSEMQETPFSAPSAGPPLPPARAGAAAAPAGAASPSPTATRRCAWRGLANGLPGAGGRCRPGGARGGGSGRQEAGRDGAPGRQRPGGAGPHPRGAPRAGHPRRHAAHDARLRGVPRREGRSGAPPHPRGAQLGHPPRHGRGRRQDRLRRRRLPGEALPAGRARTAP